MAKNVVLLSDGTGNSAAKLFKTNVWRLHGALDLGDPARQIVYYDDGVGTSSFRPLAVLGGVFGFGLKRNVLEIYRFACRNHRAGDRIFCFGFSRGAFTIRIVAGLIARQGLVPYSGNEAQLDRDALAAYRAYRRRFNVTGGLVSPLRAVRDGLVRCGRWLRGIPQFDPARQIDVETIHFVGVWDTVAAYGGPFEEVVRGIDNWLWPLSMPDRLMSAKVTRACHAVALDDERNAFWPLLWDERQVSGDTAPQPMHSGWASPAVPDLPDIDRQRLSQVWFTGMHSDVGGGYARDGLSHVALDWMLDRAGIYGLLLTSRQHQLREQANPLDKLNDSRRGLGVSYRYKPRKLTDVYGLASSKPTITRDVARVVDTMKAATEGTAVQEEGAGAPNEGPPIIHESVFKRIAARLDGYAPIVLPETYRVTTKDGRITSGSHENPVQSRTRARRQEQVWNLVWWRRVAYFATVILFVALAALPVLVASRSPDLVSRGAFLIPVIDATAGLLPGLVAPWLDAFRAAPGVFGIGTAVLAGLLLWSGALQRRIADAMLALWHPATVQSAPEPNDLLYRIRTSTLYRGFFYALTHWILPTLAALLIAYGASAGASRGLYAVADSMGLVCRGAPDTTLFDTRARCHALRHPVTAGGTYTITLTTTDTWLDGYRSDASPGIKADPHGFGWDQMTWRMVIGIPLRRHITEDWFRVIGRVGRTGRDEQPLTFTEQPGATTGQTLYVSTFRARSTGELFLFVNDAVIGLPWLDDLFYSNNRGTATVTVTP